MSVPLSLTLGDWPEQDRMLWQQARSPLRFSRSPHIAARWSDKRCRIVCQGYGQYLSWLVRSGLLDGTQGPADRVTPQRMEAFVHQLQDRVAPWSVAMTVQAIQRMLVVMNPQRDWGWMNRLVSNLKLIARPSRDKRSHMVDARELFALGMELMADARGASSEGDYHAATRGRDGLLMAMLICSPVRIANVTAIDIGRHLLGNGETYWLEFDSQETKTGKAIEAELPPVLTPWVDFYLRVHRERLLARGDGEPTRALWISRWGEPMIEHAVRDQIRKRTGDAFGKHVWPHLFRAIAATGFVDHAPGHASLLADLLGHSNEQTSKRYYVLSSGAQAHEAVQTAFEARRRAATERLRNERNRP